MCRLTSLLALCLLCAAPLGAQSRVTLEQQCGTDQITSCLPIPQQTERPRHFYREKKFWVGVAAIAVIAAMDGASTMHAQSLGASEGGFDAKHIIGQHPSSGNVAAYSFGEFAVGSTFHAVEYKLGHNDPQKGWRIVGDVAIPAVWTAFGTRAIVGNYTFHRQPSGVQ